MILKRKEFVIQWRKFGLKRSCIFKVMNLWSLCLFLNFNWFLIDFLMKFSLFQSRKRGELTAGDDVASGPRRRADVARGTSAWMRRDTEAPWQSHGWPARGAGCANAWQEATWMGPHGRPWGAPRGMWGVRIWRAHGYSGALVIYWGQ